MQVGLFSPDQAESMIDLLLELFDYYNPDTEIKRRTVEEHLMNKLLSEGSGLDLVTAIAPDGRVAGFAAIGFIYSVVDPRPEHSKQCFLKELYVANAQRGHRIGRRLMQWVAEHAIAQGCARIDWPVKEQNFAGIRFYEALGAKRVEDRLSYRISGEALRSLADAK